MKKRIIAIMIVTLMLISVIPFQASASNNEPITLELGYGEWTGTGFTGGYLETPHIGGEQIDPFPDDTTKRLNAARSDVDESAHLQDSPYKVVWAKWGAKEVDEYNNKTIFGWATSATLRFTLDVFSGWYIPFDVVEGKEVLRPDRITLKFNGSELGGYELTGTCEGVRGESVRWEMVLTFTKQIVTYGNFEAQFVVAGKLLTDFKVGDEFPCNYKVIGDNTNFYTVETNWYYAEGERGNYTRGAKVTEDTIAANVAYDCELTFRLKDDAPASKHQILNDAECALLTSGEKIDGYFAWANIAGLNDRPDDKTLTVRKFMVYRNVVKDVVVEGITNPVIGEKPVDYGITFAAPFDDWSIRSAKWSGNFAEDGSFMPGEKYYLDLDINGYGDLRELRELNNNSTKQGYKLASANTGTVVNFQEEELGLSMKIEFVAEPANLGRFVIDMSDGKTTVDFTDKNKDAFDATLAAMKAAGDFVYSDVTALEQNFDIDGDGNWDVVVQNGNKYQPHKEASVSGEYTVKLSDFAYSKIKSENQLAYYSKITFVFEEKEGTDTDTDTEPPYARGDCNRDGSVDNKDVVELFRYVSGTEKAEDEYVYDFNEDGTVDNKDVVDLFRSLSTR
ncbi:MAG: hypothetical protein IJT49_02280 [Clostridia bacterium]|nr:hypothetical protein [Clostridia bacterium]